MESAGINIFRFTSIHFNSLHKVNLFDGQSTRSVSAKPTQLLEYLRKKLLDLSSGIQSRDNNNGKRTNPNQKSPIEVAMQYN
jgi:hypothetical protein